MFSKACNTKPKITEKIGEKSAKYRVRGLDGIRAIACIAVLIYHFIPGKLVGGFLGVDVFFVLSGFLITAILMKELNRSNTIDVKRFWLRRVRRLFPAVVTVVLLIMPIAGLIGGDALVGIKRQVIGAVTFSYNWVQIFWGTSYFTQQTPEIFTNMWSLAVEQQFYIIWPLIMFIIWKMRSNWRPIVTLLLAILSIGAMYFIFSFSKDPSRVHMGTDTHSFGLMIGAFLAIFTPSALEFAKKPAKLIHLRSIAGVVGSIGILICFFVVDDKSSFTYPWFMTLACFFTLCIIQALEDNVVSYSSISGSLVKILDSRCLVWLGERSYGIYLWHWPIWVLAILWMPTANIYLTGALATVITVVLSHLSYKYIETPMRRDGIFYTFKKWVFTNSNSVIKGVSSPGLLKGIVPLILAGILVTSISYDFYKEPDKSSAEKTINANQKNRDHISKNDKEKKTENTVVDNIDGSKVTVIGDSVTLASKPALETIIVNSSVDGKVSRSILAAVPLINERLQTGTLGKVVVISLGSNSIVTEENLNDILNAIGKDRLLVLVTAFGPARTTWIPPSNEVMRAFAAKNINRVRIASWDHAIANRTDLLAGDFVHPNNDGGAIYANTVLDAIKSFGSKKLGDVAIKPVAKVNTQGKNSKN